MFIRDGTPSGFSTISTGFTVFIVRHIFNWLNCRDNTFVTVTTSHLVTRLNTTFNRKINFNNLLGRQVQVITLSDFATFVFKLLVEVSFNFSVLISDLIKFSLSVFVFKNECRTTFHEVCHQALLQSMPIRFEQ